MQEQKLNGFVDTKTNNLKSDITSIIFCQHKCVINSKLLSSNITSNV